jgi:amino acid transporter
VGTEASEAAPPTPRKGIASFFATVGGLIAAPCVIGIILIPLGLGASVMASGPFKFLDDWRFVFMGLALVLLIIAHVTARRGGHKVGALLWVITFLAVAFIAAELIVDPPWDRHALVPM